MPPILLSSLLILLFLCLSSSPTSSTKTQRREDEEDKDEEWKEARDTGRWLLLLSRRKGEVRADMDAEATVINIIYLKYRVLFTHTSLSFGVFDLREITQTENKETSKQRNIQIQVRVFLLC